MWPHDPTEPNGLASIAERLDAAERGVRAMEGLIAMLNRDASQEG